MRCHTGAMLDLHITSITISRSKSTLRSLKKQWRAQTSNHFMVLVGYFLYIDGVGTIIKRPLWAAIWSLPANQLIIILLVVPGCGLSIITGLWSLSKHVLAAALALLRHWDLCEIKSVSLHSACLVSRFLDFGNLVGTAQGAYRP